MNIKEDIKVGLLSEIIALQNGYIPSKASQIRIAATLHDIGKQKIPESILNKPSKLTPEEFEIIKTHTILGAKMLKNIQGDLGQFSRNICLYHHEWFDGNGYWGKKLNDLPLYISFVAISDVFSALISKRIYKDAWPPSEAIEYIQNKAGTQFSPELVNTFISLIQKDSSIPVIMYGGN